MRPVRDPEEFMAAPIGRCVVGPTSVIWCAARDLAGTIHWGAPDDRDVATMIATLEFIRHPSLAPKVCVVMDCRAIERVDTEVLVGFTVRARDALPRWSPHLARQAVLVPAGVPGILLAGALPLLAPAHPFRFFDDLAGAFAFLDHDGGPAAHAAASELVAAVRGSSALQAKLRAQLMRTLADATVEACAAKLGVSTRTLQRELRRLGTSFSDELRRARVAAADELLRLSDLKIDAIAARVGFGTASRMTAVLRRELGVTAGELRERARG